MYGRSGLDRFKKAQTLEPFSVAYNSGAKHAANEPTQLHHSLQSQQAIVVPNVNVPSKSVLPEVSVSTVLPAVQVTSLGGGLSNWVPPDWAIEPRGGVYYLEVMKDGEVLDRINLDKKRHIFGRQVHTCDFVLDHPSVSRQHAAVVPHKNGSIFVIDLGSVHGTFVSNERLTKDNPVELEVGQSLKFAASTRIYILRKNGAALFTSSSVPKNITLPPPPDPSDEEAVLTYNTLLNKYGIPKPGSSSGFSDNGSSSERAVKRRKKSRVSFKDQVGGNLVEVVGISDGADVETEPGPIGVKEGSLVGKYESLVQVTVIPKGQEQIPSKEANSNTKGVTDKLQQVLNRVKAHPKDLLKADIFDDIYGDTVPGKLGTSWAYSSGKHSQVAGNDGKSVSSHQDKGNIGAIEDDEDDLFGD